MKLRMLGFTLTFVACLAFGLVQSHADVALTGPFAGTISEGFESFPTPAFYISYLNNPTSIMDGNAVITHPQIYIYEPGVINFGLASSGIAQVSDGVKGVGVNAFGTTVDVSWSSPISQFGGYFAAATSIGFPDPIPVTVIFFAQSGSLVGAETFTYSHSATGDGGLDWHGWVFDEPVSSVSLSGSFFVMDGMQAVVVPEPTSLGLAILGFSFTVVRLFRLR
jgi:hypothetical protein